MDAFALWMFVVVIGGGFVGWQYRDTIVQEIVRFVNLQSINKTKLNDRLEQYVADLSHRGLLGSMVYEIDPKTNLINAIAAKTTGSNAPLQTHLDKHMKQDQNMPLLLNDDVSVVMIKAIMQQEPQWFPKKLSTGEDGWLLIVSVPPIRGNRPVGFVIAIVPATVSDLERDYILFRTSTFAYNLID